VPARSPAHGTITIVRTRQRQPDRSSPSGPAAGSPWLPAHVGLGVAVFDLDRTLLRGSSLSLYGRELVRRGIVPRSTVAKHALLELAFQRRGLRDDRIHRLVAQFLAEARGELAQPLVEAARSMGPTLLGNVRHAARFLLDHHLAIGDFCVVVSASPHELVDAVTTQLEAHRAVGTRLDVIDGVLTGRLDGPFCYGTGKLEALEREVGRIDLSTATAYADSGSDVPLLSRCGQPVAINPDAELRRWAQGAGWPILRLD
jgi:HAD superfamily hydrolase (TIGR01490 family)